MNWLRSCSAAILVASERILLVTETRWWLPGERMHVVARAFTVWVYFSALFSCLVAWVPVLKLLLRILPVGGIVHQENPACRAQVMLGLIGKTLLCFEDSRALEMSLFYPVTLV